MAKTLDGDLVTRGGMPGDIELMDYADPSKSLDRAWTCMGKPTRLLNHWLIGYNSLSNHLLLEYWYCYTTMIYQQNDSLTYYYILYSTIVMTLHAWPNAQGLHTLPFHKNCSRSHDNDTSHELAKIYKTSSFLRYTLWKIIVFVNSNSYVVYWVFIEWWIHLNHHWHFRDRLVKFFAKLDP